LAAARACNSQVWSLVELLAQLQRPACLGLQPSMAVNAVSYHLQAQCTAPAHAFNTTQRCTLGSVGQFRTSVHWVRRDGLSFQTDAYVCAESLECPKGVHEPTHLCSVQTGGLSNGLHSTQQTPLVYGGASNCCQPCAATSRSWPCLGALPCPLRQHLTACTCYLCTRHVAKLSYKSSGWPPGTHVGIGLGHRLREADRVEPGASLRASHNNPL